MQIKSGMLLVSAMLLICGCGAEGGHAKKAGRAVGETLTDFANGVGTGVDKRLEVAVELGESIERLGLEKTVSKNTGLDNSSKGIAIYFISQRPVNAQLIAKALNTEHQEIGRSVVSVEFTADDAKYVTFDFDGQMDRQLVQKYTIEARPSPGDKAERQTEGN